jgi:hypothetical protein
MLGGNEAYDIVASLDDEESAWPARSLSVARFSASIFVPAMGGFEVQEGLAQQEKGKVP